MSSDTLGRVIAAGSSLVTGFATFPDRQEGRPCVWARVRVVWGAEVPYRQYVEAAKEMPSLAV